MRQHDPDAVVMGSVGWPTFPAEWMHWFEQHLDAAFMEGFITVEGTGARTHTFGALHTGLVNSSSWQPPGTPIAPEAIGWPQLVTRELRCFTAAGRPLLTLSTINRYGHGGNTPPNEPPDSPLDIWPTRARPAPRSSRAADPENPQLPGQARNYMLQQQPRYGPGSPGRSGLAPVPGPDLSNADMFGPPAGFSPALPGGDFLHRFASADVFGVQIMTGRAARRHSRGPDRHTGTPAPGQPERRAERGPDLPKRSGRFAA